MAFTHKDLPPDLQFPRMLHKDGAETLVHTAHEAVQLILDGHTMRPGEPVARTIAVMTGKTVAAAVLEELKDEAPPEPKAKKGKKA